MLAPASALKNKLSLPPVSAGFLLVYSSYFKMEAICFSQMSGFLKTVLHYNPKDHTFHKRQILHILTLKFKLIGKLVTFSTVYQQAFLEFPES
jgi:hypothetical protein